MLDFMFLALSIFVHHFESHLAHLALGGAAGASAVEVDFDVGVVGQVILFVLLLVILKPLLFDPMLRLFEERERRIDGTKRDARRIDEESAHALTVYEGAMKKARAAGNVERDQLRSAGLGTAAELMTRVRTSTNALLDHGRADAAREAEAVRQLLLAERDDLAREIAASVLGRRPS